MHFPSALIADLDPLTEALDDSGDDLHAHLSVVADDLKAAVPSFVGLSVTVGADGDQVPVVTRERCCRRWRRGPAHRVVGSSCFTPVGGAWTQLAAHARAAYGLAEAVVLDRHLPPLDDARATSSPTERSEWEAGGRRADRSRPPA